MEVILKYKLLHSVEYSFLNNALKIDRQKIVQAVNGIFTVFVFSINMTRRRRIGLYKFVISYISCFSNKVFNNLQMLLSLYEIRRTLNVMRVQGHTRALLYCILAHTHITHWFCVIFCILCFRILKVNNIWSVLYIHSRITEVASTEN